jgi:hypothetical protein
MREGRIDDVGVADSIDQLVDADPRQQPLLAEQTVVGRAIELDQRVERGRVVSEPG